MLRKLWNRIGQRAATMTSRSRVDYRARLMLEPLEQRRMLAVIAVFNTTIDDNEMELDREGEFRLFIYGDEPVGGAADRDDTIIIGVSGGNVTIDTGSGPSNQIYRDWTEGSGPTNLGTVTAASVRAITVDAGDGTNTIDLSAVDPDDFTGLVSGRIILSGGSGVDTITGSKLGDVIGGLGGNDIIKGGDGDDLINGGDGDDSIQGGDGDDIISGGDGDDTIESYKANQVIDGNGYKDFQEVDPLDNGSLNEASGLIIGRTHPTVMWTIEDSGGSSAERLYANEKATGNDWGFWTLDVEDNEDWEDLAYYKDDDKDWLYIGEFGDNATTGGNVAQTIFRLEEPSVNGTDPPSSSGSHGTIADTAIERIVFTYPMDDPDAEAMMVEPHTGDIFIISKRERTRDVAHLYQIDVSALSAAEDWDSIDQTAPTSKVVTDLGALDFPAVWTIGLDINSRFAVSGMDISSDGLEVLVRTDRTIYHYKRATTNVDMIDMLQGEPVAVIAVYERGNRESIAFDNDSTDFYTVSEFDSNRSAHAQTPNRFSGSQAAQQVHLYQAGAGTDIIVTSISDLNRDAYISFQDLTILLANWNKPGTTQIDGNLVEADTTLINFADLTVLLAAWTGPGPEPSPAPLAAVVDPKPGEKVEWFGPERDIFVDFREAVTGVGASDMVVSGPGGNFATVGTPEKIMTGIWKWPVSGLIPGTVFVDVARDAGDITKVVGGAVVTPRSWSFFFDPGLQLNFGVTGDVALSDEFLGLSSTAVTIEVTFKSDEITSGTSAGVPIFAYVTDDKTEAFTLFVEKDSPNNMKLSINDVTKTMASGANVTGLFNGIKHHLAVTYNSSDGTAEVFVDGESIGTQTFAFQVVDDGSDNKGGTFMLGQEPDNETAPTFGFDVEQIFQGSIFEVRIYDEVRTEAEIESDATTALNPASLPSGLVHAWEFRGAGVLVSGLAIAGTKHFEMTNQGVGLLLNQGANTDDYGILRSFSGFSSSELTIEFTFASDAITSVLITPLIAYATSSSDNSLLLYVQQSESKMKLKINGSSSLTLAQGNDVLDLFDGAPHHITLVYDGIKAAEVFFDGVSVNGWASNFPNSEEPGVVTSGGTFFLGQEPDNLTEGDFGFNVEQIWTTEISDVRVFDDIRTDAEIVTDMITPIDPAALAADLVHAWQMRVGSNLTSGADLVGGMHMDVSLNSYGAELNAGAETGDNLLDTSYDGFSSNRLTVEMMFSHDALTTAQVVDNGSENKGGTFMLGQEPDNATAPTFGFDTEQIFQGSILEARIYDEVRTYLGRSTPVLFALSA
ncbi:MAG: hypothetical protein IID44_27410 [Planctomycetes bacterium]|nr:hypothetical protein [Planctomycetota bacterium]